MQKRTITITYERTRPTDDISVPRKHVVIRKDIYGDDVARPSLLPAYLETLIKPDYKMKFLSLFALTVILPFSIFTTRTNMTASYFNGIENSLASELHAGQIDFTVAMTGTSKDVFVGTDVSGKKTIELLMSPASLSSVIDYKVAAMGTNSNALCDSLHASSVFPFVYDGPLVSFVTATTTTSGVWQLEISLPSDGPRFEEITEGDSCLLDLVYVGWHSGEPEEMGYQDTETLSITIHAQDIWVSQLSISSLIPEFVSTTVTAETDSAIVFETPLSDLSI